MTPNDGGGTLRRGLWRMLVVTAVARFLNHFPAPTA
jgi:hypothetical protein